ncbi:LacI family transcriptional regulator [Iodidimonas gelatinilytica]|uniref:LacI family transcriptional regulator n=1 Tax=Iodidimonas gelatinilytica TaxID=1236966 RepID=A0A5A7MMF6_9PROT|nr:LacI family DNA-binding transcriptional regulator [Iodidimonas gelatinilytica]GEQ96383.1 LacI family transcriptional regulator [Iodidimonas gelatinilytica]
MDKKTFVERATFGDRSLYRLEDLAELAGVSISTVSRALNDSDLVSERTKARIRQIAQTHNYAGRLRDKLDPVRPTSRTISAVIPPPQGRDQRISDPFLLDLLGGLADQMIERDCDLLISHVMPSDLDGMLSLLSSGRSDGLIFLGQSTVHEDLNSLADRGVPFVVWGARLPNQKYCTVGSDNLKGGHRATSHLIRLGRRRIAFIGDVEPPELRLRFDGYKQALEDAGIAFDPDLVRPAHFSLESAMEAVESLLESGTEFDGVVAASDLIAIGAVRGLMKSGMHVPEDVSVVGYDDVRMAAYSSPALTTISQDVGKAGRLLVSKLLRILDGQGVRSELLPTELIVRESCGA